MKAQRSALNAMLSLAVFCLICMSSLAGWAQNLLTNPGFESGNFNGWSVTGTSPNYGVNIAGFLIQGTYGAYGPTYVVVHSGTYAGYAVVCSFCTNNGEYVELTQPVTLVPGDVYTASLWLGNGSSQSYGNSSGVRLNGQNLGMTTFPPDVNPGYQQESGSFIATQANSSITFHIEGSGTGAAGFSFDDFSLTQTGGPATNGGYLYQIRTVGQIADFQINTSTGALVQGIGSPISTGNNPQGVTTNGVVTYVADQQSVQISAYTTNQTTGTMTAVPGSPFASPITPVAVAVDASPHFLYASGNEHGNGAVAGWIYSPLTGGLTPIPGSPFAAGTAPNAMAFGRNGQYLYVADRPSADILAYSINPQTGALSQISGSPFESGHFPWAMVTDTANNYLYVANENDNTVSAFAIESDGALTPVPGSPFATGSSPYSLALDSAQHHLYVANFQSNNISAYQINAGTGALTPITGSPFSTGPSPDSITSSHNFLYVNTQSVIYGYQIGPSGLLTSLPGFPYPAQGHAITTAGSGLLN